MTHDRHVSVTTVTTVTWPSRPSRPSRVPSLAPRARSYVVDPGANLTVASSAPSETQNAELAALQYQQYLTVRSDENLGLPGVLSAWVIDRRPDSCALARVAPPRRLPSTLPPALSASPCRPNGNRCTGLHQPPWPRSGRSQPFSPPALPSSAGPSGAVPHAAAVRGVHGGEGARVPHTRHARRHQLLVTLRSDHRAGSLRARAAAALHQPAAAAAAPAPAAAQPAAAAAAATAPGYAPRLSLHCDRHPCPCHISKYPLLPPPPQPPRTASSSWWAALWTWPLRARWQCPSARPWSG